LTTILCGFLKVRSNPEQLARITILYDLLSESFYQGAFDWKDVKRSKIKVYHRIFRGVSGPDILTALAIVATDNVSTFASRYREGWYSLETGVDKNLEFGFESDIGEDKTATREGDLEKVEGLLSKEFSFLCDLPVEVRRALILAEVSRRKVAPLSAFDWGGIVVSFAKPVERFCKDILNLRSNETLGEVIATVEHIKAWQPVYERLKRLNQMFVRGKHLKPPPIQRNEVESARHLAFEILEHAEILGRSAIT